MFHKICITVLLIGFTGGAFADYVIPQIVTSEVFESHGQRTEKRTVQQEPVQEYQEYYEETDVDQGIPTWPLAGSDADVEIACGDSGCANESKIVSKSGSGLVIQNNINASGTGWSGGPNISNGIMVPAGFDYECADNTEMPLMRREMMEDDGGTVLAMSRSSRKTCNAKSDSYAMFAQRAGFAPEKTCNKSQNVDDIMGQEISVNEYVDEDNSGEVQDQVRSWVVAEGQTLREVLQSWCDKAGWDLVWTTSREYPIEASAVFKGRFMDVASALVRNFERATPIPYAKFYKGNRVVVVSTSEE